MNINDILNNASKESNVIRNTSLRFIPIQEGKYEIKIMDYKIEKRKSHFHNADEISIIMDVAVNSYARIQFLKFLKYSLVEGKTREFELKLKQLVDALQIDVNDPSMFVEAKTMIELCEKIFNNTSFKNAIINKSFYASISRKEYKKKDGNGTGWSYYISHPGISISKNVTNLTAEPSSQYLSTPSSNNNDNQGDISLGVPDWLK